MPISWDTVLADLTEQLSGLADREFVVLGDPVSWSEPSGLLRRRRPAPGRYVQVVRMRQLLSGECVGVTSFGGD